MSWVATAIAGSAILGAGTSLLGSKAQSSAANNAINAQMGMFNQSREGLQPFMDMGTQASGQLMAQMPSLTANFNPTMQQLEQTPGYQFTLGQGMKAVTNANSAMGLANSGVQGKGIADYAEGLASNTFNQQFQNYWQQNQNKYNMLMGPTQVGANAAAGVMNNSTAVGGNVGGNMINAGNANASGILGVGASGSNAMNQYLQYQMMQRMLPGGVNNAGSIGDAGGLVGANQSPFGSGGYNFLDAAA